jgi:ribosomal protein S18 acetylase RimI-like enzyme
MDITIRAPAPHEYAELGELTAQAYLRDGLLDFGDSDPYLELLRDVERRAGEAEVLVAVDAQGRLLGGVTFVSGGGQPWANVAQAHEAEFRMLAVAKEARGRSVGEALVRACVERARATQGCVRVVLSTQRTMLAAHRIYARQGFVRTPERDWEPVPGITLLTYALEL